MLGKNHEFHKRSHECNILKVTHNVLGDVFASSSKVTHDWLPITLFSLIYAIYSEQSDLDHTCLKKTTQTNIKKTYEQSNI